MDSEGAQQLGLLGLVGHVLATLQAPHEVKGITGEGRVECISHLLAQIKKVMK